MLLIQRLLLAAAAELFARSLASPAGAPIPSSVLATSPTSQPANGSATQSVPLFTSFPSLDLPPNASIPGAWSIGCNEYSGKPCIAYCSSTNTACQITAGVLASSCAPSWNSYWDVYRGFSPTGSGWHNVTSTQGNPEITITTTIDSYTSISAASQTFIKQNPSGDGKITFTPVYALGKPVKIETITTLPSNLTTYTTLEGPTPSCSIISVHVMDRDECGKCTIKGGTVDLFFWPPATSGSVGTNASPSSIVTNGSTLVSPSAYIHLRTAYAKNSCSVVGNQHTGTLIEVDPEDVSTQIHIGGKVAAYEYGKVDYAHLTGLPPASQYQMQPSCVMFGCRTMYSTTWFPTLKVPPQIRSIDPAWADCDLGLDGLYDPPQALQPRAAEASPTKAIEVQPTPASPSKTEQAMPPTMTWTLGGTAAVTAPVPSSRQDGITSTRTATAQIIDSGSNPNGEEFTSAIAATTRISEGGSGSKEDESTSTVTATAQIIATTRIISVSIDYSDSAKGETSSRAGGTPFPPKEQGSNTATPGALLDPTALSSGHGVVVGGHTLETGEAITLGKGRSKTTLSLQTQTDGGTLLALGTSNLIVVDPTLTTKEEMTQISDLHQSSYGGGYVIGGHSVSPGTVSAVGPGQEDEVTYSVFTRGSRTAIALGITKTIDVTDLPSRTSDSNNEDLAFTQDAAGDFVLHGTTLLPGKPVTIGSGTEKTTLAVTSLQSMPAIIIDSSVTQKLTHPPVSTSSVMPEITHAPTTAETVASLPPVETNIAAGTLESGASVRVTKNTALFFFTAVLQFLWTG